MRKTLIATLALSMIAAAPTWAAGTKQRTYLSQPGSWAYAQYVPNGARISQYGSPVVVFDNKVVGADPDLNIRAQLLRDPIPNEY